MRSIVGLLWALGGAVAGFVAGAIEAFMPRMRRTPDPKADWSEWVRPQSVDPPYGVVPPAPLTSIVELRYRVRKYGE